MIIPKWSPSKEHFKWVNSVLYIHDDKTNVDYFLQQVDDILICCFEPTVDKRDWMSDFDFFPKRFDIYPGSDILVHEGIAKQYLGMRNKFLDMAYQESVKKIYIAGFSLGGGLSQLACEDAAWHLSDKEVISISYEGPRVFCQNKEVKNLLKNRQTLIKTFYDPVVHLPFWIMGFRDYGKKNWIGRWNKIMPLQHLSEEVERNLLDKFGH
jgi:hypothetical protein